mgnify:CR=1 FL=1
MSKITKRLLSFVFVMVTMFSVFALDSFAVDRLPIDYDDQVSPCWNNVNSSTITLGFNDDGKIEAKIRLYGTTGTKYKSGTIKIQRYSGSSWVNVKTWSNQAGSSSVFTFSSTTLTALSNTKYRLSIEITAYNGSSSEVISLSKTSTNS